MNIREEILAVHSKEQALKVANYVVSAKQHFKELMHCFLTGEYRLSQRAAWSVSWAAKKKPEMVMPWLKEIVAQLQRKDEHNSVIRNSVRKLEGMEIQKAYHGEVRNPCFGFL